MSEELPDCIVCGMLNKAAKDELEEGLMGLLLLLSLEPSIDVILNDVCFRHKKQLMDTARECSRRGDNDG